jgi:twitching motility protein PilT
VNQARACHVVTLEDPIEYLHREAKAQVTQREIGDDAEDLASAFRRALRLDPDVILLDGMHDAETMRLAIHAAEAGHLVLAAFHATSAILAPERIVEAFPREEQRRARMQLAEALQGIVCQTLLPRAGGGMVLAQEVLVVTAAVRAHLRDGKAAQLAHALQGGAKEGMQTLEESLNDLVAKGLVTYENALARANHPKLIEREGKRLRPPE